MITPPSVLSIFPSTRDKNFEEQIKTADNTTIEEKKNTENSSQKIIVKNTRTSTQHHENNSNLSNLYIDNYC